MWAFSKFSKHFSPNTPVGEKQPPYIYSRPIFDVIHSVFLLQMLPLNTNIPEAYACGQDQEQNFIQNLAMFLCTYLKEHSTLVEKDQLHEVLMKVRKDCYLTCSAFALFVMEIELPQRYFCIFSM